MVDDSNKRPISQSFQLPERGPKRRQLGSRNQYKTSDSDMDYGSDPFEGLTGQELDALEQEAERVSGADRNVMRENRGTSDSDMDYGSDPFEGLTVQELDALEQEAERTSRADRNARRENRGTSDSDMDYGSDPFEGLTVQELDALEQEAERTSRADRSARRENRGTSDSDSDYGSNPFEGLTGQELDALEQEAERNNTTAGSTPTNRGDDLRSEIQSLQNEMFRKLFPVSGFETNPQDKIFASASDRFQAASEILHDRGSEFEHDIVSLINSMPRGLEQIKSIQKLSPVLQNFSIETRRSLWKTAEKYLFVDPKNTFEERVEAQKFLTIARDHLDEHSQKVHEDFSYSGKNRTLVITAQKELLDDFARDMDQRKPLDLYMEERDPRDNKLLKYDIKRIVNQVERHNSAPNDLRLSKADTLEIRQSAYQLRRVVERMDFSRSEAEGREIEPHGIVTGNRQGKKSQPVNATDAAQAGGPATKEHTAELTSKTQDGRARQSATSLRLELRDAHRENSPHSR